MIELSLRVVNCIGDVDAAAWDACANPGRPKQGDPGSCSSSSREFTSETYYNPFISHDFLSALELGLRGASLYRYADEVTKRRTM